MGFWRFVDPGMLVALAGGGALCAAGAHWLARRVHGRMATTDDALRSSEARNRAAIDTMLDAHVTVDRQGIVTGFNPAAQDVFGWPAADIIGQPVHLLINGGDQARRQDWSRRSDQFVTLPAAYRRRIYPQGGRRRDGTLFPLELAISDFTVDGQQLFSCTIRDLSERWEREARLLHLASAVECAGDAITIMDPDRRIRYVNAQYERQTGFARDEVLGQMPDLGADTEEPGAEIWATLGRGQAWSGLVQTRRRDGSVRDEELTLTPVLDSGGTLSAYVAVARDVTRRLEMELERRRLAEALEHCADSIEILDAQGRIVYVNAAYQAGSGQRLADIRGSRPEALRDFGVDTAPYEDMLRTAYRGGRPWSGTLKAVTPDGELHEADVTVSPMRDEHERISGYVVVKRDTTDRRRLEALAQQRQKLQSIGEIAGGIATGISGPLRILGNELRRLDGAFNGLDALLVELAVLAGGSRAVPPATLGGCLQGADAGFLRSEARAALAHSHKGLGRIVDMVDAMGEITGADREKAPADINRIIRSIITVATAEWEPVAELRSDLDPALPAVRCNVADVSLALLDLLLTCTEAMAASHAGGLRGKGTITVSSRSLGQQVELRIGFAGHGLQPGAAHELLDRRAGAENPALAMAREVVVGRHGGSIALDTHGTAPAGLAAAFVIRLPLEAAGRDSARAAVA